jgi:tetraacyldisaccharide 4'-kinase
MSLTHRFDEIVSGRQQGPTASIARGALQLLEAPYAGVIGLRNRYYDRTPRAIKRVKVPVISVGNLTMGGTGKTPMVAWLARWFAQHSLRPVIISRGYGTNATQSGQLNDEAQELHWRLPAVPHVQNPNRVDAARAAIDNYQADVIILDDGFQHRRLHRDLNIVLIDATQPFGYDHVFPRGTLREPVSSLRRADVVVITRSALVNEQQRTAIQATAAALCPQATWLDANHRPTHLSNLSTRQPLSQLAGQPIAAFCGIGRPQAFRESLIECGYEVVAFRPYADHHEYTQSDMQSLSRWAQATEAAAVVCTQKDHVKLAAADFGNLPLWSLAIEMEFENAAPLEARLRRCSLECDGPPSP